MIKWIKKNIWQDPVWSKVIANGITFIAGYYFYKFTNITPDKINVTESKNSFDTFINMIIVFFQTNLGKFISYIILGLLVLFFIFNFYRMIRSAVLKYSFNKYRNDCFWQAIFKWKWTKYGNNFQIDYDDIEKICPICRHDLTFRNGDYYFVLKCNNCTFESEIFYTSSDDPEAFALNLARQRFLQEFHSKINARLRQKGLK